METNFNKVQKFNKFFEVPIYESPQQNIFSTNPKLTKRRLDLIDEEVEELHMAIKENNFIETIDALADILYVVYGAAASFGINADVAFDIVHKSNMSKLCNTELEAIDTVKWYEKNSKTYKTPSFKKSEDGKYWIVFNKDTGKILKSIKYTKVNFGKMLNKLST